jgi:peptide chain release factor 2
MADPDLWKNRASPDEAIARRSREMADAKIKEIGELNELIKRFDEIEKEINETKKLFSKTAVISPQRGEMPLDSQPRSAAPGGNHARSASETFSQTTFPSQDKLVLDKLVLIENKLRQLEIEKLFTGKYDKQSAVISIYAGAGGQDAEDWAGMLFEMYFKFCAKRGWKTKVIDESRADFQSRTGRRPVKDITFEINGKYAYGYLKKEAGVHRLVRISPFSPEKKRHTSFALVEVLPDMPFDAAQSKQDIEIPEKDLKTEFSRSSGPGGQNVNKVETAVRIVHLPTGLAAASQVERSQSQNRERAMNLLKAKLLKLMEQNEVKELDKLKVKVKPEWGSQIRSYVLQPYQLVKDHRSGVETTQVDKVLAGDLDLFVESDIPILSAKT